MDQHSKLGYREGLVSVILNLLLFVLKYYAGIASASLALIADAWHTLSDSLTSLVVILGIKLSSKKPDKEHPFGHGRWEQISALIIAILLALIGVEFMKDAIAKLRGHEAADFGWLAYLATVASIVLKEGLARYAFYIARKTGNAAVKADGWHHRSDALSSLMVLAGLFLSPYFWWIDSVLGMLISFMLFYAAYGIIREAVNKILGEEPSEEVIGKVEQIVKAEMGNVAYPHHYHIHHYGDHIEFTFHIKVPGEETVEEAHRKATLIEMQIKTELKIDATIHIEPLKM
ncbi:cation diffusion facilitator family transporter [Odoribacter splanchnicus]|jgi:cation diffusion facilitator family transporter|uniref:cation diffusion facilitator family transporter n=1 Tax=Odoribacter splanchnicus TaxID=28118 RepID=UPI0034A1404B